jgi:hypothetical protein
MIESVDQPVSDPLPKGFPMIRNMLFIALGVFLAMFFGNVGAAGAVAALVVSAGVATVVALFIREGRPAGREQM